MKRALVLLIGLILNVLLLENLFLWTPALKALVATSKVVEIDYDFAWTLVPGRVHVAGYTMSVDDRAVQMQIDAAEGVVDFDLLAFSRKEVHITRARGRGYHYRMRFVLSEEEAKAPWVELVPPIKNIPFPPLWRHPERVKRPIDKLWTVKVEDLDLELEELWVGPGRLDGQIHLQGGFELHPRQSLTLQPTRIEV
ncbi:MAG: hypothetical protein MK135_13210 [Polyangiaceae bacterium]|nr:hypothetical protein [Polyangiaceae bacterium]